MKTRGVTATGISRLGGVCALGMALLWAGSAWGSPRPQNGDEGEPRPIQLKVLQHLTLEDLGTGALRAQVQPRRNADGTKREVAREHPRAQKAARPAASGNGAIAFYPADLTYQGGAVVTAMESHDIYVNCDASCFGSMGTFLNNLGNSAMMHVVDQYVGSNGSHRYTVGRGGIISDYPVSGPLGPNDFLSIAYTAASAFGNGYGHEYHIFFAPGIDVCLDAALTICYSPDNLNTWAFCAFHGSFDVQGFGHVLFSVEPYANVVVNVPNDGSTGCQVNQPSPNGPVTDSQANVLSHELFETITDPDGDAWWNLFGLGNVGEEIGDECADVYFAYANTNISGHLYEIQPEYSNAAHACVFRPAN